MPFFDNTLGDPDSQALSGFLSGLASGFSQGAMPSRAPIPFGAIIGQAAASANAGAVAGGKNAQSYRGGKLENTSKGIENDQNLIFENAMRTAFGGNALTADQYARGDYGTASPLFGPSAGTMPTPTAQPQTPTLTPPAPAAAPSVGGASPVAMPPDQSGAKAPALFDDYYSNFLGPHEGGFTASDGNGKPANYGINQGANPDIDVSMLTPAQAKQIAYQRYWLPSGADKLPPVLAPIQADTAFNMGVGTANQLLQQSGGDPQKYLQLRAQRYQQIAVSDPSKAASLPVWMKRNTDLANYAAGFQPDPSNTQPADAPTPAPIKIDPNAPMPDKAAAAMQMIIRQRRMMSGKDRYQMQRNGWAYDTWTNQWQHFPQMGTGVTGKVGPDGEVHAAVADGEQQALSAVSTAQASGPAAFKPITVYDAQGNEYMVPSTSLQNTAPAQRMPTSPSQGATPAPIPSPIVVPPPGAAGAPNTPVQNSRTGIPINLDTFIAKLGPNYTPPSRPAGPPGSLMGAPNQGQEEVQKDDATRLEGYATEASGGQKIYSNLEQLYGILGRGLSTGNMTASATKLTNYAHQLGMDNLVPKNFDPNDAGAFNKLSTDLVFAQLKQIGGRPMVSEIEGLKQANPNTSLTPAANTEILNNILADQRWRDARADLGKQYMMRYGSLGDFDARFNEQYPEVDTFNKITTAAAKAGWKLPGAPGTPSGAPAIPAKARAMLKEGIPQKFSNGQVWTLKNGQPVQVK